MARPNKTKYQSAAPQELRSTKLDQPLHDANPNFVEKEVPELSSSAQLAFLQTELLSTRARRFKMQGMPFKTKDQNLMLAALDVQIGFLLLQIEDLT